MLKMAQAFRTALPCSRALLRPLVPVARAAPRATLPLTTCAARLPTTRCAHRSLSRSPAAYAAAEAAPAAEETFEYQAEVDRLMDMIVNSLYSNKEVFMRELVSNCSDALDKVRIQSLTDEGVLSTGTELEVKIKADKEAKTITIEDTGVGMTKEELLSSLGTIARSGTAKFAEAMKQAKTADSNLIGQFGVGFYSSFLVADRVTVQTKSNDDEHQWCWESAAGSHKYSVKDEGTGDISRGTRVTLHIKEDAEDLLEENEIQRLIRTYSEFISFPIRVWGTKSKSKRVEDTAATEKAQAEADAKAKEEGKEEAEKVEPVMKDETEVVTDWEQQNVNKPIWTRPPKDVTDDEYNNFFTTTFKEFVPPMARSHFNVEGTYEFSGLLFIPGMAPFDQFQERDSKKSSIRLFVKRVFISDQFDEQLLPKYLGFVNGIVDSSDLPLNVSREILQESRVVRVIRKQLVKRCIDMIGELAAKGEEEYEKFWSQFGRNIKLGVIDDSANQTKLASLMRYKSSKSGDVMTGLDDYISRMKDSQSTIYYIATESEELASNSPFVENLVKKDVEVLYFTEPIDEWCAGQLAEYEGKKLVDVTKEGLELEDDEKERIESATEELKPAVEFLQETLGGKVSKVSVSARLTDSPCILVTSKTGWSANMQRIMKSQPMGDSKALDYMKGEKILEVNPDNAVIKSLNNLVKTSQGTESAREVANLMYDTALLTSGFDVDSPKAYAAKVYGMMGMALTSGAGKADAPAAPEAKKADAGPIDADQVIEEK